MSGSGVVEDRRATVEEVRAARGALAELARGFGLRDLRLRRDGAVVVAASDAGYTAIARFVAGASEIVGAYVHVLAEDTVGAETSGVPL